MDREIATYPPLDVLKPVAEDVWIVDSGPISAFGIPLPVRMTVIRLSGGDLLLHSPTRYTPALHGALAELGEIRHLLAPNIAHWMMVEGWQAAVPGAVTWGAPGLSRRAPVRKSGLRVDRELGGAAPPEWAGEVDHTLVRGSGGFREVALFHLASRTLVLTDLVQNLKADKLPPFVRPLARLAGITAPNGRAPVYLRAAVRLKGATARDAGRRLVELEPDRVIFAHGAWFAQDGAARLRRSLRWLAGR